MQSGGMIFGRLWGGVGGKDLFTGPGFMARFTANSHGSTWPDGPKMSKQGYPAYTKMVEQLMLNGC